MSEPLTATYRLDLTIDVSSQIHKQRFYVEASPSILSADGYYLFDRSGIASIQPRDAAAVWWSAIKEWFNTSVGPATWILYNFVAGAWNPVASGALTGNGTSTAPIEFASQVTISLRTSTFKRIRMVILEQSLLVQAGKSYTYSALHTVAPNTADAIFGTFGGGASFQAWVRSRNKKELDGSNPLVSFTFDLNDKVRRARGLQ